MGAIERYISSASKITGKHLTNPSIFLSHQSKITLMMQNNTCQKSYSHLSLSLRFRHMPRLLQYPAFKFQAPSHSHKCSSWRLSSLIPLSSLAQLFIIWINVSEISGCCLPIPQLLQKSGHDPANRNLTCLEVSERVRKRLKVFIIN